MATTQAPPRHDVTIRIPRWLARTKNYASMELTGEVLRITERGVQLRAVAVVRPSDHCLRCGTEIRNPVSRLAGYGPWCSDELGIPRNFTPEQIEAVRAEVESHVVVEWFPLARVEVLDGRLEVVRTDDEDLFAPALTGTRTPPTPATDATLTIEDGRLYARTPFAAKDLVKSVPGSRWHPDSKRWWWQPTEATAYQLVGRLRGASCVHTMDVAPEVTALAEQHALDRGARAAHKVDADEDVRDVPLDDHGVPRWIHQRRAWWYAREGSARGIFIGMGGGKSRVVVDLIEDAGDELVLILCPKNVVGVWPKQFATWGSRDYDVVAPRKGTVARRADEIRHALVHRDGPLVVVVNYESAWREPMNDSLLAIPWDRVILDESHRIKAPNGKASKFCGRLGRVAKKRLALTGTPMPHSPLDVFGQYRFLDPGLFGMSFVKFRARYAVMGGYGGYEVLGYQREDELAERTYSLAYRIADDELDAILGLEEPVHETIPVELSPKARSAYDAFWHDLVADVGKGKVKATNALVRLLRAQQITGGHVPAVRVDADTELEVSEVEVIDTAKRDVLADWLEDVPEGEPVVVVCRFVADLDNVAWCAEQLGRAYGEISGRRKDALAEDATLAPGVQIAGVQIASGGVGIDLSRAHYCVLYSVGYSLGDYGQMLKRTHRPGQTTRVSYVHLVAERTVDEMVYDALANRKDVVDWILGLAK